MPVFKNEDNGTWYVMARYVNWKGEHKQEYCRRFDYGNDYIFDQFIRVFTVNLSDNRNAELLAKYQHAILYSLKFVRNELQNMSYEGYFSRHRGKAPARDDAR